MPGGRLNRSADADAHFFENSNVLIPREGGGHKSSEILQYCLAQALAFYMSQPQIFVVFVAVFDALHLNALECQDTAYNRRRCLGKMCFRPDSNRGLEVQSLA